MKTVLFAIDHPKPDPQSLDYALKLCRRMAAGLEVLHIVRPPASPGVSQKSRRKRMGMARKVLERAMATVTFADAGGPDPTAALKIAAQKRFRSLLPEKTDVRIVYTCVVTDEAATTVIERHVNIRRYIVLTVMEPEARHNRSGKRKPKTPAARGRHVPKLSIPLVFVKHAR